MDLLKSKFDQSNKDKIDEKVELKNPNLSKIGSFIGDDLVQIFDQYDYDEAIEFIKQYNEKRKAMEDRLILEFISRKTPEFQSYQEEILSRIKH